MERDRSSAGGPVMLSLASRQAWPHILAAAHFKPSKLVLLHSADPNESLRPAERLKRFFDETQTLVGPGGAELGEIPADDFAAIQRRLNEAAIRAAPGGAERVLNFTGGNKLMAAAAFRWAERNGAAAFYIERGDLLMRFDPSDSDFAAITEKLPGDIADDLEVLPLLRCQLSASDVERAGERLTLSDYGRRLAEIEFRERIAKGKVDGLMHVGGTADREAKKGDALELQAAAVALKLGAREVRRSLRLKVDASSVPQPHAEIDLIFNRGGKLWLVDCKDRASGSLLVRQIRDAVEPVSGRVDRMLNRLADEMKINPIKALKEDLVANVEVGGLRGKIVCVRRDPLPEDVHRYAKGNGIDVVHKQHMFQSFRRLMHPGGQAAAEDLDALKRHFAR